MELGGKQNKIKHCHSLLTQNHALNTQYCLKVVCVVKYLNTHLLHTY